MTCPLRFRAPEWLLPLCIVRSGLGWFYVAHLRHVEDVGFHTHFPPTRGTLGYCSDVNATADVGALVIQVAKREMACVGQASAHAVTIASVCNSGAPVLFRFQFPRLHTLNAHAALLHNASASHRDIWIQHHAHQAVLGRVEVCKFLVARVVKPIEPSNLVWAVVRAIPCSDAPVVRHLVQTFIRVRCCSYWTNRLTWCVVAMLAHHWHVNRLRIPDGSSILR